MAEASFNNLSKRGKAISAGTNPDTDIHPWTIQVMKEIGLDVTRQKPKLLTEELVEKADRVIIMDPALLKSIPFKNLSKFETWQIDQLFGKTIEQVRAIREKIRTNIESLIKEDY
jgi:arsenate reductase (thioredoxin)